MNFDLKKYTAKKGAGAGYVMRNGQRIATKTAPPPAAVAARLRKRAQKDGEAFARIPLWWARRANEDCGQYDPPNIQVCVELIHQAWKAGGKSFTMPNGKGINRKIKRRSLLALEAAGLIKVIRRPRRLPVITLLDPI
jgi:hypothetical protein